MGEDLGGLLLGQAVVHRPVQMERDLGDLPKRDQRGNRDQAAIARHKVRAYPGRAP